MEVGVPGTPEYRKFLVASSARYASPGLFHLPQLLTKQKESPPPDDLLSPLSPLHDVPLHARVEGPLITLLQRNARHAAKQAQAAKGTSGDEEGGQEGAAQDGPRPQAGDGVAVVNMVCTSPRGTWAQFKVGYEEPFHPLRSALTSRGVPRHYADNLRWNVGVLPQTWVAPNLELGSTDGNTHPGPALPAGSQLEVIDVSNQTAVTGESYAVVPVGAFLVVGPSSASTEWKVVAVSVHDDVAKKVGDVDDLKKHLPGVLERVSGWLERGHCTSADDVPYTVGLQGSAAGRERALSTIAQAHSLWVATWQQEGLLTAHLGLPPWTPSVVPKANKDKAAKLRLRKGRSSGMEERKSRSKKHSRQEDSRKARTEQKPKSHGGRGSEANSGDPATSPEERNEATDPRGHEGAGLDETGAVQEAEAAEHQEEAHLQARAETGSVQSNEDGQEEGPTSTGARGDGEGEGPACEEQGAEAFEGETAPPHLRPSQDTGDTHKSASCSPEAGKPVGGAAAKPAAGRSSRDTKSDIGTPVQAPGGMDRGHAAEAERPLRQPHRKTRSSELDALRSAKHRGAGGLATASTKPLRKVKSSGSDARHASARGAAVTEGVQGAASLAHQAGVPPSGTPEAHQPLEGGDSGPWGGSPGTERAQQQWTAGQMRQVWEEAAVRWQWASGTLRARGALIPLCKPEGQEGLLAPGQAVGRGHGGWVPERQEVPRLQHQAQGGGGGGVLASGDAGRGGRAVAAGDVASPRPAQGSLKGCKEPKEGSAKGAMPLSPASALSRSGLLPALSRMFSWSSSASSSSGSFRETFRKETGEPHEETSPKGDSLPAGYQLAADPPSGGSEGPSGIHLRGARASFRKSASLRRETGVERSSAAASDSVSPASSANLLAEASAIPALHHNAEEPLQDTGKVRGTEEERGPAAEASPERGLAATDLYPKSHSESGRASSRRSGAGEDQRHRHRDRGQKDRGDLEKRAIEKRHKGHSRKGAINEDWMAGTKEPKAPHGLKILWPRDQSDSKGSLRALKNLIDETLKGSSDGQGSGSLDKMSPKDREKAASSASELAPSMSGVSLASSPALKGSKEPSTASSKGPNVEKDGRSPSSLTGSRLGAETARLSGTPANLPGSRRALKVPTQSSVDGNDSLARRSPLEGATEMIAGARVDGSQGMPEWLKASTLESHRARVEQGEGGWDQGRSLRARIRSRQKSVDLSRYQGALDSGSGPGDGAESDVQARKGGGPRDGTGSAAGVAGTATHGHGEGKGAKNREGQRSHKSHRSRDRAGTKDRGSSRSSRPGHKRSESDGAALAHSHSASHLEGKTQASVRIAPHRSSPSEGSAPADSRRTPGETLDACNRSGADGAYLETAAERGAVPCPGGSSCSCEIAPCSNGVTSRHGAGC